MIGTVTVISLVLAFIVFVMPLLFLWLHMNLPHLPDFFTPKDFQAEYQNLELTTSDNIKLKGWYIPAKDKKATMIVCHGVAANKSDILKVGMNFHKANYDVYMFDFRGHGASQHAPITYGWNERKDIKAIVDYIKSTGVEEMGIYGLSMGGAIVMQSLPENPELKAVIIDSGFASAQKIMDYRINMVFPGFCIKPLGEITKFYGRNVFKIDLENIAPIDVIDKIDRPILFIVGDKDKTITPDNGQMLYDKAKEPKEIVVMKGADHTQTISDPSFEKVTIDFMDKYLLKKEANVY